MSSCESLRPGAAFLATLPEGDPERRELEEHARTCAGCAAALREGQQLGLLLGQAATLPAPSAASLRRASAPVVLRLRAGQLAVPAAAALGFAIPLLLAQRLLPNGSLALRLLVLALAACALLPKPQLALGLTLLGSFVSAFAVGRGLTAFNILGWHCLALEQVAAILPFGALLALRRGGPLEYAAAAAGGALAGQAALHLTCPNLSSTHLFAFHFAGVVVAALWGAAGGRLLARRPALSAAWPQPKAG